MTIQAPAYKSSRRTLRFVSIDATARYSSRSPSAARVYGEFSPRIAWPLRRPGPVLTAEIRPAAERLCRLRTVGVLIGPRPLITLRRQFTAGHRIETLRRYRYRLAHRDLRRTASIPDLVQRLPSRFSICRLARPRDQRRLANCRHPNGQPAVATFLHDRDGHYHAHGIQVITLVDQRISRIVTFQNPSLRVTVGLPQAVPQRVTTASPGKAQSARS